MFVFAVFWALLDPVLGPVRSIRITQRMLHTGFRYHTSNKMARASTAWHQFFDESVETTDVSVRTQPQAGAGGVFSTVVTLVSLLIWHCVDLKNRFIC